MGGAGVRGGDRGGGDGDVAACVPWVAWQAAGRGRDPGGACCSGSIGSRLAGRQVVFYARRMPDQILGPAVEVATVFAGRGRCRGDGDRASRCWPRRSSSWAGSRGREVAPASPGRAGPGGDVPAPAVWPFTEAGRFLVPLVPFLLVGCRRGARLASDARSDSVRPGRARDHERRAWSCWRRCPMPAMRSPRAGPMPSAGLTPRFEAACARIEAGGPAIPGRSWPGIRPTSPG